LPKSGRASGVFFKFILIFNALVLGPKLDFLAQYRYFLYISKYDSCRHSRTQFRNLLTQLTTVNRNTTYIGLEPVDQEKLGSFLNKKIFKILRGAFFVGGRGR
jgi:hypothetical protein